MLYRTSSKQLCVTTSNDLKVNASLEVKENLEVKGVVRDKNTLSKEEYEKMKKEILQNA